MTRLVWMAFIGVMSGCTAPSAGSGGEGGGGASSAGSGGEGGSGGGGGAVDCSQYQDVTGANDVVIRIVNQRSTAVFVDTSCGIPFEVQVGGVTHAGALTPLQKTCFALRSEEPHCCDCDSPGTQIDPGSTWETHWPGIYYDTTRMPVACYSSFFNDLGPNWEPLSLCEQPTLAVPGPIRLVPHVSAQTFWTEGSNLQPAGNDFVFGTDSVVEVIYQ